MPQLNRIPVYLLNVLAACATAPAGTRPEDVVRFLETIEGQHPQASRRGFALAWGHGLISLRECELMWDGWIAIGQAEEEREAA